MATTTLYPGAVSALFNPSLIEIVGAPPQLADGSDATYYTSHTDAGGSNRGVAEAPVDAFSGSGTITGIDIVIRAATDLSSGFEFRLADGAGASSPSGLGFLAADVAATPDGAPHWYTKTLGSFDVAALAPVLVAGTAYFWMTSQGDNNYVTYYEAHLVVTYAQSGINPLRRYPRPGATGPTRHWPRSITRRPGTY